MANGHKYPRGWECVSENTFRLKLNSGWLIRETLTHITGDKSVSCSVALKIHIDPKHQWVLEEK